MRLIGDWLRIVSRREGHTPKLAAGTPVVEPRSVGAIEGEHPHFIESSWHRTCCQSLLEYHLPFLHCHLCYHRWSLRYPDGQAITARRSFEPVCLHFTLSLGIHNWNDWN